MANFERQELTALEYVFLTLGAGLTLQKNDKVVFKKDLAERTILRLASKVSVSDTFTFDFVDGDVTPGTDVIAETAHGMANGDPVRLSTTGTLPAGLELLIDYFVVEKNDDDFKLSLTSGGAAVDITAAAGGGTHTLAKLAQKLKFSNFEITTV